jgi:2-octaprenyl-6-methoxyphenol hydroxylase
MDNPAPSGIVGRMDTHTDVVIVGGGLVGPLLALALAQAGLSATVVEARPPGQRTAPDFDGRAYALALASRRMLTALGLWPALAPQAQPILGVKASDGRPGEGASPLHLAFDHAEIEEGPMGHMIEDRFLHAALRDACIAAPGITLIEGDGVTDQSVDGPAVTVTLTSGRRVAARLLVGCDGRASPTATRAGIRRTGWGYGQTALVCAVAHDLPHQGIAHQLFLPSGPLAILPLTGNRSSVVWIEAAAAATRIAALPDADYLDLLRPRFGNFLGEIRLVGDRFTYPIGLSLAQRFTAQRLALAGDAAHGVHPLAGQGLNLGLRDVAALAEVLADARRRGEDIGAPDVLARYSRWRRFDTTTMALGMDVVNRAFSNDNPVLRLGRDLTMGAITALPGLRRRFLREAAGLTGDLPRLLQGRPV